MITTRRIDLTSRNDQWIVVIVFLVSLLFVPLVTHSIIDHPPEYDELLHVLAARSTAETGQPSIADGLYPRAFLYTKAVSMIASPGANELRLARIPALLAGALLVALLGGWVTRKAGWIAGLSAAAVLTLIPETPHLSAVVRFYTVHALLMTTMLLLLYEALEASSTFKRSTALIAIATIAFVFGMHFQVLSQVTLLGGIAGVVALIAYDRRDAVASITHQHPIIVFVGLVMLIALVIYLANLLNILEKLRGVTPAWSIANANDYIFYLKNFTPRLPLIWPLLPVLIFLAWIDNRRMTVFFLVVFLVCLIISSIASQKATRYIYHFAPVIAILAGLGILSAVKLCTTFLSGRLSINSTLSLMLTLLLAGTCLVNAVEVQRAVKLATGKGTVDRTIPLMSEPDWLLAVPELTTYLEAANTVIASSGIKSLHAFGRYDYELSRTVIDDTLTKEEFGLDGRTGRLVISTPESVSKVLAEPGTALIVIENRMINQSYGTSVETIAAIEENCSSLEISLHSQLSAWICNDE